MWAQPLDSILSFPSLNKVLFLERQIEVQAAAYMWAYFFDPPVKLTRHRCISQNHTFIWLHLPLILNVLIPNAVNSFWANSRLNFTSKQDLDKKLQVTKTKTIQKPWHGMECELVWNFWCLRQLKTWIPDNHCIVSWQFKMTLDSICHSRNVFLLPTALCQAMNEFAFHHFLTKKRITLRVFTICKRKLLLEYFVVLS